MKTRLPKKGETITIRCPGTPYDFVMEFEGEDRQYVAPPGWHYLFGGIVSPANWWPNPWAPLAHLVDGEWTMVPRDHRIAEDGTVVPIR